MAFIASVQELPPMPNGIDQVSMLRYLSQRFPVAFGGRAAYYNNEPATRAIALLHAGVCGADFVLSDGTEITTYSGGSGMKSVQNTCGPCVIIRRGPFGRSVITRMADDCDLPSHDWVCEMYWD